MASASTGRVRVQRAGGRTRRAIARLPLRDRLPARRDPTAPADPALIRTSMEADLDTRATLAQAASHAAMAAAHFTHAHQLSQWSGRRRAWPSTAGTGKRGLPAPAESSACGPWLLPVAVTRVTALHCGWPWFGDMLMAGRPGPVPPPCYGPGRPATRPAGELRAGVLAGLRDMPADGLVFPEIVYSDRTWCTAAEDLTSAAPFRVLGCSPAPVMLWRDRATCCAGGARKGPGAGSDTAAGCRNGSWSSAGRLLPGRTPRRSRDC